MKKGVQVDIQLKEYFLFLKPKCDTSCAQTDVKQHLLLFISIVLGGEAGEIGSFLLLQRLTIISNVVSFVPSASSFNNYEVYLNFCLQTGRFKNMGMNYKEYNFKTKELTSFNVFTVIESCVMF